MSRQFVYEKKDGSASRALRLSGLMEVARTRVKVGEGPFKFTQDGEQIGKPADRQDTLDRLQRKLVNGDIGPTYRIRNAAGDIVLKCREIEEALKVIDTNGNAHADFFWTWVVSNFEKYRPRWAGSYVCKHISGSSNLSQHSYGNATDVFFDSFAHQEQVATVAATANALIHAYHIISGDRIWTKGSGWSHYGGEWHSHLHVDFDPQFSGPCGVRQP